MKTITITLTTEEENNSLVVEDLKQGIHDCAGEYVLQSIKIEAQPDED